MSTMYSLVTVPTKTMHFKSYCWCIRMKREGEREDIWEAELIMNKPVVTEESTVTVVLAH